MRSCDSWALESDSTAVVKGGGSKSDQGDAREMKISKCGGKRAKNVAKLCTKVKANAIR